MKIRVIRQTDNQFTLDIGQADIQANESPANQAGDAYSVNLPGIPPAASVDLTSGGSEVTATLASTVLVCTLSAAKAALVNKAVGQNIDVVLTRSSKTYAFEFTGDLDVKDQANP
jgi:hypothetical protein